MECAALGSGDWASARFQAAVSNVELALRQLGETTRFRFLSVPLTTGLAWLIAVMLTA